MMIHQITEKVGRYKKRKRVGRGPGSGHGKTCGRGHKGAKSRAGAGGSVSAAMEGGQMPLFRRVPKRGFSNARFRKEYEVVNLKSLQARFADGDTVDAAALASKGLIGSARNMVKVLGEGDLEIKLTVTAAKFSKSAEEKITKAGGSVTVA